MPFERGVSGTADFWVQDKTEEDVRSEALARIKWLEQEERHVETVLVSLHKMTQNKKPKDIPKFNLKQLSKSVLLELKKLEGAFGELKHKSGSESGVKAFAVFVDYFEFWKFLLKNDRLPGFWDFSHFKILKFNVKSVEHVLEDIAKLLGKSVVELKSDLRDAHKRFKGSNLEIVRH